MDPSYTNDFGSFGAGGLNSNPQQPIVPGGVGVSAGSDVSAGFGASAASQGGAMPGAMPGNVPVVSSGTGDIVLSSGGSDSFDGRKSRKGLIAALIILVVLAVGAGVGYALWQGGVFGGNGGGSEMVVDVAELRSTFNKYANYVYRGEESERGFELDWNWKSVSELKFMLGEDEDLNERTAFFRKAKELNDGFYEASLKIYNDEIGDIESGVYILQNFARLINDQFNNLYTISSENSEIDKMLIDDAGVDDVEEYYEYLAESLLSSLNNFNGLMEAL